MGLLSMTDASDPDNRVQARHELDRAEALGDGKYQSAMSDWAIKWGRELLDGYDETVPIDEDEIAILKGELESSESDAVNLRSAIRDAISDLQDAL